MIPRSIRNLIIKSITTLVIAGVLSGNAFAGVTPKPKANNFSTLKNYETTATVASSSLSAHKKNKAKSKKDVIDACVALFDILNCLADCL